VSHLITGNTIASAHSAVADTTVKTVQDSQNSALQTLKYSFESQAHFSEYLKTTPNIKPSIALVKFLKSQLFSHCTE